MKVKTTETIVNRYDDDDELIDQTVTTVRTVKADENKKNTQIGYYL